jgi:hypothetical protein
MQTKHIVTGRNITVDVFDRRHRPRNIPLRTCRIILSGSLIKDKNDKIYADEVAMAKLSLVTDAEMCKNSGIVATNRMQREAKSISPGRKIKAAL